MNSISTLIPAYGRDYKSRKAVESDFNADKDFKDSWSGQYINRPQIVEMGLRSVNVRYNGLRSVAVVKVK